MLGGKKKKKKKPGAFLFLVMEDRMSKENSSPVPSTLNLLLSWKTALADWLVLKGIKFTRAVEFNLYVFDSVYLWKLEKSQM